MRPAGLLCALLLPSRYLGLVLAWALFAYFLATEPALRLPLAAYLAFILSPAGRRAVGRCRWPPLLRRYPLYTCFPLYAPAQLIKTADLGPGRKYLLATHPHGVLGNSSLLALGTEGLGWGRLFPGVRLSYGARSRGRPA